MFWDLSRSRVSGMAGPSGIPPSEVATMLDFLMIRDGMTRFEYAYLVGRMDAFYMTFDPKA